LASWTRVPRGLLLEGRPRIDKTTVARRRLLPLLQEADLPVGGFTTAELRAGGRREGFLVEAASGAPGHTSPMSSCLGPPKVGKYSVDLNLQE
jgi:nucleoside-triphosphatase